MGCPACHLVCVSVFAWLNMNFLQSASIMWRPVEGLLLHHGYLLLKFVPCLSEKIYLYTDPRVCFYSTTDGFTGKVDIFSFRTASSSSSSSPNETGPAVLQIRRRTSGWWCRSITSAYYCELQFPWCSGRPSRFVNGSYVTCWRVSGDIRCARVSWNEPMYRSAVEPLMFRPRRFSGRFAGFLSERI